MEMSKTNEIENDNRLIELYSIKSKRIDEITENLNDSVGILGNSTSEQSTLSTTTLGGILKKEDKENNSVMSSDLLKSYIENKDEGTKKDDDKFGIGVSSVESLLSKKEGNLNKVQKQNVTETKKEITIPEKIIKKQVKFKTVANNGKPMMMSSNKKKVNKPRGRPKRKELPIYQSQISDNKCGIKLCIKKSLDNSLPKTTTTTTTSSTKNIRKRSKKPKQKPITDSEDSEYEKRRRKSNNNNKKIDNLYEEPEEQSPWATMPQHILHKIFLNVVTDEGSLPSVIRFGKVCSYWNKTSLSPMLWQNIDLATWIKERHRTELKLKWIILNRLTKCTDINLGNWKVTNIQCVLVLLLETCPNLIGIGLSGWRGFTSEHLTFLIENFTKLKRIDLSSVNVEINSNKSAVAQSSLCNALQTMKTNLTNLYLAHNRLAGIPQLITTLATHCPNLLVLDLSNVNTISTSHGIIHIEKLQIGCPKLKVLLITNSHITMSSTNLQEQMDSPGFPDLEELSVASLADESRLINDEYLQRILKTSTKLKLLDVRGCARLTHDSLIRLPTWDIKHLFLSGCSVTRDLGSGLELIASKWAHSLTEVDFAWANVQGPLDNALKALAEKGSESPLSHLNLCGSSVSVEAVKEILKKCTLLNSINLSSCRSLPRGVKRFLQGTTEINELKETLGVTQKIVPTTVIDDRTTKPTIEKT